MFRESNLDGSALIAVTGEGALRHPDGSINFGAYREKARLARQAAIASSIRGALAQVAGVFAGKPVPTAKHHAT